MKNNYDERIPKEIVDKLNVFQNYKFYDEGHFYTCNNKRIGTSMTGLIHQYSNPFKAEEMASMTALKNKKENKKNGTNLPETTLDVLETWRIENKFSTVKGSECHLFAQEIWKGNLYEIDYSKIDEDVDLQRLKNSFNKIKQQALNFYEDYKDILIPIADEFLVGSEVYDIGGSIDNLFYNILSGEIVMVDYKTNKEIKYKGFRDATMLVPLDHLQDCNYIHYCIQLNGYEKLFEDKTGLKIGEKIIVYFDENADDYEIIEVLDLKKETIKILENRRTKNMNSVPILLIGKSGSGKSTSLRNFTKDEVAVINVLGKPLPFKTDIKAPKIDDYKNILNQIGLTKKKIIVIDDANYLITNEFMAKSSLKGYDKYNEMANNFFELINGIKNIEGGKTVYLIMHEDVDDDGNIKPKTIGKLLDDKVNIQGMFTICIRSIFENGQYIFRLETNGQDCVKTPFGMFETETMDNDLKEFDRVVRDYYELDKKESEEK